MRLWPLLIITLLLNAVLIVAKFLLFGLFNSSLLPIQLIYLLFVFVISIAAARRLGILNYFEGIFGGLLWLVFQLILDYIFIVPFFGFQVFKYWYVWLGHGLMVFAVIFIHKKRHVLIRRTGVDPY